MHPDFGQYYEAREPGRRERADVVINVVLNVVLKSGLGRLVLLLLALAPLLAARADEPVVRADSRRFAVDGTPATVVAIRPGDTLFGIARTLGVPVSRLVEMNGVADPSRIRAGDTLFVPSDAGIPPDRRPAEAAESAESPAVAQTPAAQSPWRQADFAADLHRRAVAVAEKDANVVVSPWGVASLFAMLQAGARGDTARGMAFALQLGGVEPPRPDDVCETFRESRTALSRAAREDVALELSDSLWIKPGFALSESFRFRARDAFDADVRITNMGAAGRKAINEFVSEKTHGRIPNLLAPPVLDDPLTRLVAVDTIYLKAEWSDPFDPKETSDRTFHAPDGDFATPFLHATRGAEILDAPECAALRLPYLGGTLEMLVLLPSPSNTLADVEARLGRPYLDRLAVSPWRGDADIAVPKFEFDSVHDLKPILEPMGMGAAFDVGRADFSGIAPHLYVGTALQKANITVDENGTEAAAGAFAEVEGWDYFDGEDAPPPRPFVADKPFLFLIRETRTGLILFLGRVCKPSPPRPANPATTLP